MPAKYPPKRDEVLDQLIMAYESITAKIILYCVYEIPFSVTEGNLIKVLRGSKSAFIMNNELSLLTTYGILLNFSRKRLKRFIRVLKKEELLASKSSNYGHSHLILTERGRQFISSGESIITGYFDEVHGNHGKEIIPSKIDDNRNLDDLAYELKNNPKRAKRAHAAYLMGESLDPIYITPLCEATKDSSSNVRRLSASALGKIKDPRCVNSLINLLDDEKDQVKQYAVKALGMIGDVSALPYLEKMKRYPINYVKDAAEIAIIKINRNK